jgi:hypothetical protein
LRVGTRRIETAAGHEIVAADSPAWPAGWFPAEGVPGDLTAIERLDTADLEWHFRDPLPEWSRGTGWRRAG